MERARPLIRGLLIGLGIYLALGLVFSLETLPQEWECPEPNRPGETFTYSGGDASSPDCESLVTTGDTLQWVVLATPFWAVFLVGQGLND